MRPKWFPDWSHRIAIVVASGPSASGVPLEAGRGRAKFIAVNDSWKICPWADILYAGDYKWWEMNEGCPEFRNIKVSIDRRACETQEWGITRLRGYRADNRISFDLGIVGGSNSGLNALNLAAQLSPARILMVGFDMTIQAGVHWHGPHSDELKNPTEGLTEKWRRAVDGAAEPLAKRGIEVINCSPISTLRRYRKMNFIEALCLARFC